VKLPFIHISPRSYTVESNLPSSGKQSGSVILSKCEKSPLKAELTAQGIKVQSEDFKSSTRSVSALKQLESALVNTADCVMDKLKLNKQGLSSLPGLLKTSGDDNRASTKQEKSTVQKLNATLINHVALKYRSANTVSLKESRAFIKEQFAQTRTHLRNNKPWNTLNNTVSHNHKDYACTLIPAGNMKLGNDDIFPTSYSGKGVCSSSTKDTRHAVNLWSSEISVPDENGKTQTLFKGLRHGILSPFSMKASDPARQAGALARAKEVATAALFSKPELLKKALAGQTVPLQIVSTALVTASKIQGEDGMLKDQVEAWKMLSKQTPSVLSVRGENGKMQEVKINIAVAAFNFGVNEMALKFGLGWSASDKYNADAINQLLGSSSKPGAATLGGMVGDYLKTQPANALKVNELAQQLMQILSRNSHHRDGGEPYKAAQRVTMLAYEIGAVPCWNCKSGKDRTGMLDAEIKREAISQHQGQPLSLPATPLDEKNQKLFQQVLLNGGNNEIQAYNTSASGNKVLKNIQVSALKLSYDQRIGDTQVWKETQGLSRLVKG